MPSALEQVIAAATDAKDPRPSALGRRRARAGAPAAGFTVILPGKPTRVGGFAFGRGGPGDGPKSSWRSCASGSEGGRHDEEEEVEIEVEGGASRRVSGPARLLAVDDDFDILRMLDRTLKSAGYIVDLARDGRGGRAEAQVREIRPGGARRDAPHVHGSRICARLKGEHSHAGNARHPGQRLVSRMAVRARRARDFRADDYLEKTVPPARVAAPGRDLDLGRHHRRPRPRRRTRCTEGIALLETTSAAEAREVLEKAVKEDPFSPRAHFASGGRCTRGRPLHAMHRLRARGGAAAQNLFHALRALAALYEQKGFLASGGAVDRAVHAAPRSEDPRPRCRQRLLKLL